MKPLIYTLFLLLVSAANAAEVVKTCEVGREHRQRVQVIREAKIASTYLYSFLRRGELAPFFGGVDESRGDGVLVQCVGKHRRALIVSGEFTANVLQGFVLLNFAGTDGLDRLDFAEKARPGWLYLGEQEAQVVIATLGRGESDAKYVIYRHVAGQPMDDPATTSDALPPSAGFEVIQLKTDGHR